MVKSIVSDNSEVVLSSHRGLSSSEILEDCLEKARAMLQIVTTDFDITSLPSHSQHQYLALLDDLVDLAHQQLMRFQDLNQE